MSTPKDPTHPKAFEPDNPLGGSEQDDMEGHGMRKPFTVDAEPNEDVEGPGRAGQPSDDSDDVEGHGAKFKF